MRKTLIILLLLLVCLGVRAVDMQAPMSSQEAQTAYSDYLSRQSAYYTGRFHMDSLRALRGDALFARLNELMGATINMSGKSYNTLRSAYEDVDRDLNREGYIIGYYDGRSMNGTWDSGKTYNREHTWPQSKGADKGIPMGYDMQSVRPTSTAVNGDRGNTAYGESSGYYDPNDVRINNSYYRAENNGSYRGDAARIILYDYIVYGERAGHQNQMYNGNAQLLNKLGKDGVFESVEVMVRWSEEDLPSLTEMVRNDGAQTYQGNRNPFIDMPELVRYLLLPATVPTSTDQVAAKTKCVKVIRNGQLVILRGNQEYSVLGNVML